MMIAIFFAVSRGDSGDAGRIASTIAPIPKEFFVGPNPFSPV